MKTNPESPSTAPQAANLVGDFAFGTPNPDARWSTVPSASINSEAPPQDSGVLAGNGPLRKFEDHVKQWPDEKLSSSQVAWDSPHAPQWNRNAAGPNPNWPQVSQSSGLPVASQPENAPPTVLEPHIDPAARPDSVSAPMVSSQSGRQTPRLSSPPIEVPKPSTTSPRPKHFIQQPTKRA